MIRLLAYAYVIRGPQPEKSLAVDLAVGLMRAITPLAEKAARLPAGPSNPGCNAGMSFIALRDASPLAPGRAARRLFLERLECFNRAAQELRPADDPRLRTAATQLAYLYTRAVRGFDMGQKLAAAPAAVAPVKQPVVADDSAAARSAAAGSQRPRWPMASRPCARPTSNLSSRACAASMHASASPVRRRYFSPTSRGRGSTPRPCRWRMW